MEGGSQVLTIMSIWNPPPIGAPLTCNILCIELDNWWDLHAYDSAKWGPCKTLDFWLILNGLHAIFYFWIWNLWTCVWVYAWFGHVFSDVIPCWGSHLFPCLALRTPRFTHQWPQLHAKVRSSKMGLKPMKERNSKMEGKGWFVQVRRRQRKDPHKPWNCHNGLHSTIDKIEGSLKKLTRAFTKPNSISKLAKVLQKLKKIAYIHE